MRTVDSRRSQMPGFTAAGALHRHADYAGMVAPAREATNSIQPASCKCDWWEWIINPIGCGIRQGLCDTGVTATSVTHQCYTKTSCKFFTLWCNDCCVEPYSSETFRGKEKCNSWWYPCGVCSSFW